MERTLLLTEIETLLNCAQFKDYCPNGLQIQGHNSITKIACAVTASAAVIEQATLWGADALLVHHGYFWRGEDASIVGMKYQRVRRLMQADMNLIAYHLPLDAHPVLGNNAQLGLKLGLSAQGQSPIEPLVWFGEHSANLTIGAFCTQITDVLGRTPLLIGEPRARLGRVAWCTGGAQDYIHIAAQLGANTYISGEVSERTYHEARELGINYLACGHHATERFGIQALGEYLAQQFGLDYQFFDENNPV
ncbi:MAG: Nif3-like dinuclear metal center hexameric protein [Hydromonas sp.]|nr:Nif3-like dinuclear metal center hexameric protein [Hydromonas sp.]